MLQAMTKPGRNIQLPYTILREIAVLDGYLGASGPAHVFQAKLKNLTALIGEMMIAGESDPNFFKIDYKFTIGKAIEEPDVVQAIRSKADALWKEFKLQAAIDPDQALKTREEFLRVIDSRLIENPGLAVK